MNFSDRNILIDWIHGPVLIEHERRLQHIKYIEHIIAFGDTVSEKCVIVSGVWYPHLIFALSNGIPENESENVLKHGKVDYVDLLSLDQIYRYQQQKIKIYYVTSAEKYNYNASGLDITRYGAGELKVE
jgi:hypothetical protein